MDAMELLKQIPDESIDLVLTDPPYNMNYSGRGKDNEFKEFANDNLNEKEHSEWFNNILKEYYRVLKDNKSIYIWIDFRNYARIYNLVKELFDIKNCIIWDKKSIGMGQCFRFQHEMCIYAWKGKGELYLEKKNIPDIWQLKRDNVSEYNHPTQKPLSAMEKPILYSTKADDLILDVFMGSWTTAVA